MDMEAYMGDMGLVGGAGEGGSKKATGVSKRPARAESDHDEEHPGDSEEPPTQAGVAEPAGKGKATAKAGSKVKAKSKAGPVKPAGKAKAKAKAGPKAKANAQAGPTMKRPAANPTNDEATLKKRPAAEQMNDEDHTNMF